MAAVSMPPDPSSPSNQPHHQLVETALEGQLSGCPGSDGSSRKNSLARARVSLNQARKIAARYAAGETLFQLAISYGLRLIYIRRIIVKQGGIIRPPGTRQKSSKA